MKIWVGVAWACVLLQVVLADFGPSTVGTPDNSTTTEGTTTTIAPEEATKVPWGMILAGGYIPFAILCGVSLLFSFSYMQYYQHKREKEISSTLIATLALTVALLTIALVPVDIYLVSSLKQADGSFQNWATAPVIDQMKKIGQDAYYAMYALDMLFVFILLPLFYFFFEEKDEEAGTSVFKRFLGALKYTLIFVIVMAIFMCIGAFATSKPSDNCAQNLNSSNAKDWAKCRGEFAEKALIANNGSNAISFTFGCLVVIGLVYFIFYTGVGAVLLPINMIKSRRKVKQEERDMVDHQQAATRSTVSNIKGKYKKKKGKSMSGRDHRRLIQAQQDERSIEKARSRVDDLDKGILGKVSKVCRPFEFIFGFVFFILSFFLFVCLVMTSTDKLMQLISNKDLGWKLGYTKTTQKIINPLDFLFVQASRAFPVDYVLITVIVFFLVLATLSGVKALGVRFCYLKMYKFRVQRTVPQGLLFLAFILMFVILALNVVLLSLSPQYVTYGHQHYPKGVTNDTNACLGVAAYPSNPEVCSSEAPRYLWIIRRMDGSKEQVNFPRALLNESSDDSCHMNWKANLLNMAPSTLCNADGTAGTNTTSSFADDVISCEQQKGPCVQTRLAALLHTFFFNFWFLGAIYYWANWGFILIYMLAFIYYTCTKRKSLFQAMLNDVNDDMYDSDDDITPFRPSWA
eukprot:m.49180 g.49180  ORF g.49180 m.49180 type:complete len:688 (+) comp10602_c0_seq1:222-2285(+)